MKNLTELDINTKISEILQVELMDDLDIQAFSQYETIDIYDLESINRKILEGLEENIMPTLHGSELKKSQRYILFTQQDQICTECGLTAKFWALQKSRFSNTKRYHLNLYGINNIGQVILFTKDHVVPKSFGGKDKANNYVVMCSCCNEKKSNKIEDNPNFEIYSFNSVSFYKNKLNGKTYIVSKNEQNKKVEIDTIDLEKLLAS